MKDDKKKQLEDISYSFSLLHRRLESHTFKKEKELRDKDG
jgi:hypothetical protein